MRAVRRMRVRGIFGRCECACFGLGRGMERYIRQGGAVGLG